MYFDPSDRPALKAHAKQAMRACSPNIYLTGLLFLALNYAASRVTQGPLVNITDLAQGVETVENYLATFSAGRAAALSLATFVMSLFLAVVSCGWMLYTLRVSRGEDPGKADTLFSCFKQFGRFVIAQLLMELFVMLWSFLFIIPGIIAVFAYSQTFYLMLDDPDLRPREALRRSRALMRGHKMEYFILSLSFVGWTLLSLFTVGLLDIWLRPYMDVTVASYYNGLVNWRAPEAPQPEEPAQQPPKVEDWWKQ